MPIKTIRYKKTNSGLHDKPCRCCRHCEYMTITLSAQAASLRFKCTDSLTLRQLLLLETLPQALGRLMCIGGDGGSPTINFFPLQYEKSIFST